MKESKPIITSDLKTLLKRYSNSDALRNLEKNYNQESISKIDPNLIDDSKFLINNQYTDDEISQFAKDVNKNAYQPLIVRAVGKRYEIIIGRKNLFGAKSLNLKSVNCLVKNFSDEETLLIIASYLREQKFSDVVEEAYICHYLRNDFGYKNKDLGVLFKQSPSQISNILQLLNLDPSILELITKKQLSYGHVRAFSRLDKTQAIYVVAEIFKNNLSVRQTESLVRTLSKNEKSEQSQPISENLEVGMEITENKIILSFSNETDKLNAVKRIEKLIKKRKIHF